MSSLPMSQSTPSGEAVLPLASGGADAAAAPVAAPQENLSGGLVLLLAVGTGVSVASLYYSQPMLGVLGGAIHAGEREVGMVPTLTQLGYALGLLLLAPLGDRYDRRKIILLKGGLLALALLAAGLAPSLGFLLAASLAVGLTATMAQDLVPAAATLAPAAYRGRVVGTVMTGLLLGILLSRVVSGFVAEQFGWRAMYVGAAVGMAAIGAALWRDLPRFAPSTSLSYGALMGSLFGLWRRHPALRRAAVAQGLLSLGFSAFWSTLAVMLHEAPFHLGSAAAGAFGLAGAAGALAAPLAGRVADRSGPERVTRLAAGLAALSFLAMAGLPLLPDTHGKVMLIVASAIGFDFGIQAALVAHQTIVYGIDPGARSRLNALLFTSVFVGMSVGAALGSLALAQWGWMGVVGLTTLSAVASLLVRLAPRR
ncbi:MFS transporter [Achromobacter aloeverae]|uniref:MFS transporter n=1 Tax=Achromobacter aloeverae TaxID=1750518 RepID=A0A4V1MS14_9BURK|nr:MFS transporter [Achromobacter aloeverae]RXN87890.1 MFS transporter [Achromobacter aloeverae]